MLKENGSMRMVVISGIAEVNKLRMSEKRTRELRRIALIAISRFYKEHGAAMGAGVADLREELIVCFMKGFSVKEAYRMCTGYEAETESLFDRVKIGKGHRFQRRRKLQKMLN